MWSISEESEKSVDIGWYIIITYQCMTSLMLRPFKLIYGLLWEQAFTNY